MADYACIKNGKVINVIVAEQKFIDEYLPISGYDLMVLRDGQKGNIGQLYENNTFYTRAMKIEEFTPTQGQLTYTLSNQAINADYQPANTSDIQVVVNGEEIKDFTFENNAVTFSSEPTTNFSVIYFFKDEVV